MLGSAHTAREEEIVPVREGRLECLERHIGRLVEEVELLERLDSDPVELRQKRNMLFRARNELRRLRSFVMPDASILDEDDVVLEHVA